MKKRQNLEYKRLKTEFLVLFLTIFTQITIYSLDLIIKSITYYASSSNHDPTDYSSWNDFLKSLHDHFSWIDRDWPLDTTQQWTAWLIWLI